MPYCAQTATRWREIRALAVKVHHDHRRGKPPLASPLSEERREQFRIHVPGRTFAVDEYRACAEIDDRIDARSKGQRRDDHFITGPHPGDDERQMERRGAGIQGNCRPALRRAPQNSCSKASTCGPSGAIQFVAKALAITLSSSPDMCGEERWIRRFVTVMADCSRDRWLDY